MHPQRTAFRAAAAAAAAIGLSLLAVALPASGAAPADTDYVTGDQISADGSARWFADVTGDGTASVVPSPSGEEALRLRTPANTDGVRVLLPGDPASAASLDDLLQGAEYTYRGANINFQVELAFTPADPQYGPDASDPSLRCTQAVVAGAPVPGACYTVLKWEPLAGSPDWTTVDLSARTAADSTTGTGGWKNTNRVGIYAKPGPLVGNTLDEYLAQMSDLTVLGAGVALGSGSPGAEGWVRDFTFGGTTHRFAARPVTPTTLALTAPATAPIGYAFTVDVSVVPATDGTVVLRSGTAELGRAAVVNGRASIELTPGAAGPLLLEAAFTPSSPGFAASTSSAPVAVITPAAPAAPPAADTTQLDAVLDDRGVDVAAATASFVTGDTNLHAVDATKPLTGSLPWPEADAYVDVYAYSTPTLIGTFPVINGVVQLAGADLSALAPGDHHLVFIGAQSGAINAIALAVAEAPSDPAPAAPSDTTGSDVVEPASQTTSTTRAAELADTGSQVGLPLAAGALALVVGGVALALGRRKVARG